MSTFEFSRPVRIGEIGQGGLEFPVEANEEERNALATLLGVVSVNSLKGDVEVKRWRRGGAKLIASYTANLTRECVATLEPFDTTVSDKFEICYADPKDEIIAPNRDGELILEPDSDDVPEILENGRFDAGEAIVEHIALNLDPYPRAPGAEFQAHEEAPAKESPFAVLQGLKDKSDQ